MSGRRSKIRSRCDCGHRIILVDGHWQHVEPHPKHACSCTEPKPSDKIGIRSHRALQEKVNCGIATMYHEMRHFDPEVTREFQYMEMGQ